MSHDDAVWEKSEEGADAWLASSHQRDRYVAIKDFIPSHRGGKPVELKPIMGGCNISFRWIMCTPIGSTRFSPLPNEGATESAGRQDGSITTALPHKEAPEAGA